jgi:hypothetical protein
MAIFVGTITTIDGIRQRAIANSGRELQNTITLLTSDFYG